MPSRLDPYLGYLEKRVAEGCSNGWQLWREISQIGYPGRPSQVNKWMQLQRSKTDASSVTASGTAMSPLSVALPSLHICLHLLTSKAKSLLEHERIVLSQLQQVPVLKTLYDLVLAFATIVRQRQADDLDAWLSAAGNATIAAYQRFAASLKQDYEAVKAALELPWSNGQTEDQVNRLKMLKHQMYGRASLDLLRLRLLYVSA